MAIFPTARQARQKSTNDILIFNEIKTLESAILSEIENNNLSVQIDDSTMTDKNETEEAKEFFKVWRELKTDRSKEQQMNAVLSHFQGKGYSIVRKTNPETNTTFIWEIKW